VSRPTDLAPVRVPRRAPARYLETAVRSMDGVDPLAITVVPAATLDLVPAVVEEVPQLHQSPTMVPVVHKEVRRAQDHHLVAAALSMGGAVLRLGTVARAATADLVLVTRRLPLPPIGQQWLNDILYNL
jgi:hypothetical protein